MTSSMMTVEPCYVNPAQIVPAPEMEIVRRPVAPVDVPPEERCVDLDMGDGWHVLLDGYNWRAEHPDLGVTGRYLNREGAERAIARGTYGPAYAVEAGQSERCSTWD